VLRPRIRVRHPRLVVIIGSICGLILASTFYSWRFAYFWLDDFNNLFWVQQQSFARMLWYNVNPFADFFRPFGMLVYWILWQAFGLAPLPYHTIAWILHTANVFLLYVLLSRIIGSRYAAAVGALLFGFRSNFTDIYWSFGTIFELLACLLVFLAILIYAGEFSYSRLLFVAVLYLLAIKSKEMAVTLPAILLLYDVCIRKEKFDPRRLVWFAALGVFTVAWSYVRFLSMGSDSPANPYYMDFSAITMGRGYGWYFDHLYGLRLRWGAWTIAMVLLAAAFAYAREKRGLFFIGYFFITLLPVVFLVNHRYEFFWYLPFFGIAGLAALVTVAVERQLRQLLSERSLEVAGVIMFGLLAVGHYVRERAASAEVLENERSLAVEYASFVQSIRGLPSPENAGTVLIKDVPRHFTPEVLTSAVQVILRRTDIHAEVVR
jgi:hypothetical protein